MIQVGLEIPLTLALGLLFLAIGSVWLIVRLSKRRKQVPFLSTLGIVGLVASLLFGVVGTLAHLVKAFGAASGAGIDPSEKAMIVGAGIAEAMNALVFGVALWIPSLLIALVVERTIATDGPVRGEPPSA